nr:hypothetical protein Itr_chr10CG08610 [Ipomoea trifida]GMD41974.1 hypothetical protein Iba_chr10bCG4870 [Ipomoea batatas]GMD43560.1 hypothetical protein Iba_chr10cCG6510 [Ipomoea batatas]
MTSDGPKAMVIQKVLKTALSSIKISNAGSIEKKRDYHSENNQNKVSKS